MMVNYTQYINFFDFEIYWHLSHLFAFLLSTLGASFFIDQGLGWAEQTQRDFKGNALPREIVVFNCSDNCAAMLRSCVWGSYDFFNSITQLNNLLYQRTNGNQINKSCKAFKICCIYSYILVYIRQFNIFLFLSMASPGKSVPLCRLCSARWKQSQQHKPQLMIRCLV